MNSPSRSITNFILLIVTFGLGIWLGMRIQAGSLGNSGGLLNGGTDGATTVVSGTLQTALIDEAWSRINTYYVDRAAVNSEQLTYGAISGMVESLGDTGHSRFLSPAELTEQNTAIQGQYEGIGVEVQIKNGEIVIVSPFDNSPAQRAGLKPGDVIVEVDGVSVLGLPLSDVVSKILGPSGSAVKVTVRQASDNKLRTVDLKRQKITINPVSWAQVPGTDIAHLRISSFNQNVGDALDTALKDINKQGMKGIILDLRNNPGGLLSEAIATASEFIPSGDVVLEQNAKGDVEHVAVQPGGDATKLPMAVLVNVGSASSSEIVAGAIQDNERGKVVGDTTFGTGTVLNQFNLSDGSAMLLATEQWLTPDGRTIWHKGITPDVPVALADDATLLLPAEEATLSAEALNASTDTQLLAAVKLLK